MSTRNDIRNELREWDSPLADMSRAMPYAVPQGYFAGLPGYTDESIKAAFAGAGTAPDWGRVTPYLVPAGYFETLPQTILQKVSEPAVGFALPKHNPQSVPEGYFDMLPAQLLAAVKANDTATPEPELFQPQPARSIPLGNRVWRSLRWAAAAVVILGVSMGSYNFLSQTPRTVNPKQALSSVSESTINEYVQQNIDEFDMELIENTVAANTNTAQLDANLLTEDEIRLYLEETGWETEIN